MLSTKHNLFSALATGGALNAVEGHVLLKVVNAVEREDGSNKKWNVTGYTMSGNKVTVFVVTID